MDVNQPQNQGGQLFQLNVDPTASMALKGAASWAKVLAIVGIILGVLFVIFGIIIQNAINGAGYYGRSSGMVGSIGLVTYIICGLVMIVSSIFALNFANKISAALSANDQVALSAGFGAARNYFAFWAVICIIFLLLLLITVVAALGK